MAAAHGVVLHELTAERATLEEVFLELTGEPGERGAMIRLFAAELLKLKTLRGTWGFVVVAVCFAGLFTAGNIGGMTEEARLEPEVSSSGSSSTMAFSTRILSLLLGIVLVTNEFRHGTIARTLLATPRRSRLVATKLAHRGDHGCRSGCWSPSSPLRHRGRSG